MDPSVRWTALDLSATKMARGRIVPACDDDDDDDDAGASANHSPVIGH